MAKRRKHNCRSSRALARFEEWLTKYRDAADAAKESGKLTPADRPIVESRSHALGTALLMLRLFRRPNKRDKLALAKL